ncbi:MAG: sodium:solute symporter family protein [Hespellia sp.]|nr:sodium:solute symporter family protein [Hespellia sp.]
MVKMVIAFGYVIVILIIGILSAKKIKSTNDFTVAGQSVPFWTNVSSMASMGIGAGATMGVASLTYACGISGNVLGIGAALGGMLAGVVFVRKIYESGEHTVPSLLRSKLGKRVAAGMNILVLIQLFSAVAAQIRSLGIITQIFIPTSLAYACIGMTLVAMIYVCIGGKTATTKTDSINIIIMVVAITVIMPIMCIKNTGGFEGMVATLPDFYFKPFTMGPAAMFAMMLWITATGMTDGGYFLHYHSAKSAGEARKAMIVANAFVVLPYMLCCGLIGLAGAMLLPGLENSDSIIPAMVANYTTPIVGGIILAGLLAAVMGTTAGVLMITSVTLTENVVKRVNSNIEGKKELTCQRVCIVIVAALGILVALKASSIVSIMQDLCAPAVSVALPMFVAIFYWKKVTEQGAFLSMIISGILTIGWYLYGVIVLGGASPFGIHHIIIGIIVSALTLVIGSLATYRGNDESTVKKEVA